MNAPLRRGWCPGALRPMEAKDGLLVRLRMTGGIVPASTACALADLSLRHGSGLFDLSARGNLQMRGVTEATLPALQEGLMALGLLDASPGAEAVRNVIASPLAGLHGGFDIRPLVEGLERRLAGDKALRALPGKFGFLIDDGIEPNLAGIAADIRFDWTGDHFSIGLGGTRETSVQVGCCTADGLIAKATGFAEAFLDLATKRPDLRRMRCVADALAASCGLYRGGPPPAMIATTARDVVGLEIAFDVQKESRLPCVGLAAPFGRLDAGMLGAAACLANAPPYAELRLTPFRVLLVPGLARLQAVPGFITDPRDPRLAVAACVGAPGCARGTTDTHADASAVATFLPSSEGIALHVSGCEKGCAKPSATARTLVARDGRYDLVHDGQASDVPVRRGLDLQAAAAAIRSLA